MRADLPAVETNARLTFVGLPQVPRTRQLTGSPELSQVVDGFRCVLRGQKKIARRCQSRYTFAFFEFNPFKELP